MIEWKYLCVCVIFFMRQMLKNIFWKINFQENIFHFKLFSTENILRWNKRSLNVDVAFKITIEFGMNHYWIWFNSDFESHINIKATFVST
jgi:hypothetical protein